MLTYFGSADRLRRLWRLGILLLFVSVVLVSIARAQDAAEVPTLVINPEDSSVRFAVKSSVKIEGTFTNWNAGLTFTSTDPTTGVLTLTIQADSVDTGSGLKNGKLKGKDFFDVKENPTITYKSTKLSQTGPDTFELAGDFTIRGVTKTETLMFRVSRDGKGSGTISGSMAFDRKDYGMNKGIPLVKVADRVEVTVDLKVKHVGGPLLNLPPVTGSSGSAWKCCDTDRYGDIWNSVGKIMDPPSIDWEAIAPASPKLGAAAAASCRLENMRSRVDLKSL